MLRSVKYGLYAAVLAGVVGGTVAWHSVDKTVALTVDGQTTSIHTTAGRVGDVLQSAGYHIGVHDLIAPSPDATVRDGGRIVLQRGRLLHLDVNGVRRDIWTTAPTVAAALNQLGYSTADFTSVSRSKRLPLSPTDLSVRTPRFVSVVHDRIVLQVATTDATVGQLLSDLNVSVGPSDQISAPVGSAIAPGEQIIVGRVKRWTLTVNRVLPFSTKQQLSSSLSSGQTKIVTAGKDGLAQITYALVSVDGSIIGQTPINTAVLSAPTQQVVNVGTGTTAAGTAPGGTASGGSSTASGTIPSAAAAQAIGKTLAAQRGWGQSEFDCLVQMWDRESGWRVNAANSSGAYGIPQALPGDKMASAGPNWQTDAATQIRWGLGYIAERYGTPCSAWSSWQANGWY